MTNRNGERRSVKLPIDPDFLKGRVTRYDAETISRGKASTESVGQLDAARRAAEQKIGWARGKRDEESSQAAKDFYTDRERSADATVVLVTSQWEAHRRSVEARRVREKRKPSEFRRIVEQILDENPTAGEREVLARFRAIAKGGTGVIDEVDNDERTVNLRDGTQLKFSSIKDLLLRARKKRGIRTRATRKRE